MDTVAQTTKGENVKWISVEEELPQKRDYYLCLENGEGLPRVYSWYESKKYFETGTYDWCHKAEKVTHWMPLPELPRGN